jgi:hypothetical protein
MYTFPFSQMRKATHFVVFGHICQISWFEPYPHILNKNISKKMQAPSIDTKNNYMYIVDHRCHAAVSQTQNKVSVP